MTKFRTLLTTVQGTDLVAKEYPFLSPEKIWGWVRVSLWPVGCHGDDDALTSSGGFFTCLDVLWRFFLLWLFTSVPPLSSRPFVAADLVSGFIFFKNLQTTNSLWWVDFVFSAWWRLSSLYQHFSGPHSASSTEQIATAGSTLGIKSSSSICFSHQWNCRSLFSSVSICWIHFLLFVC